MNILMVVDVWENFERTRVQESSYMVLNTLVIWVFFRKDDNRNKKSFTQSLS